MWPLARMRLKKNNRKVFFQGILYAAVNNYFYLFGTTGKQICNKLRTFRNADSHTYNNIHCNCSGGLKMEFKRDDLCCQEKKDCILLFGYCVHGKN